MFISSIIAFLLLTHPVSSQDIEPYEILEEIENLSWDNFREGVSEYIRYRAANRQIIDYREGTVVVEEGYWIQRVTSKGDLLLYTYGYGDVSVPALYNLQEETKVILYDLARNGSNEIFYKILQGLYFHGNHEIVFTALNPLDNGSDVGVYDIQKGELSHIGKYKTYGSCGFNNGIQVLCTRSSGKKLFTFIDVSTRSEFDVPLPDLQRVVPLSRDAFLGIGTSRRSELYYIDGTGKQRIITTNVSSIVETDYKDIILVLIGRSEVRRIIRRVVVYKF